MNFDLVSPTTTEDLLRAIDEHRGRRFRFGAGYTDLLLDLEEQQDNELTVINLARLNDPSFTSIVHDGGEMRIGALVTASRIIADRKLQSRYPVLCQAAGQHGSRQIRHTATVGGNLCTASPAGDMACALVALRARCDILPARGDARSLAVSDFFLGVRETDLKEDEVLRRVIIPTDDGEVKTHSDFIKIGKRRSMECAVVSIAYHIESDGDDTMTRAGIAIGSVAPTIKYARSACEYLVGKRLSSLGPSERDEFAAKVVEYASPISDIRASAWYREDVLFNMSKSILENH
ncbi:MAG: FAD binding domain-containing protein [Candidatus Krumholzibacteria bacterium]|nr:FAD binding domain-containing protein [Candidatus Krumholzibacteria bacterium]